MTSLQISHVLQYQFRKYAYAPARIYNHSSRHQKKEQYKTTKRYLLRRRRRSRRIKAETSFDTIKVQLWQTSLHISDTNLHLRSFLARTFLRHIMFLQRILHKQRLQPGTKATHQAQNSCESLQHTVVLQTNGGTEGGEQGAVRLENAGKVSCGQGDIGEA